MNRSDEQKAHNEVVFREVNERIEELSEEGSMLIFLCECDQADCLAQIELTKDDYEAVRANPAHFVTLPGHEDTRLERVVERHSGFVVAEKQGEAAEIAIEHDPRS